MVQVKKLVISGLMALGLQDAAMASFGARFGSHARRVWQAMTKTPARKVFGAAAIAGSGAVVGTKIVTWKDLGDKPFDTLLSKWRTIQDGNYETCSSEIVFKTRFGGELGCDGAKLHSGHWGSHRDSNSRNKITLSCPASAVQIKRFWSNADGNVRSFVFVKDTEALAMRRIGTLTFIAEDIIDISLKHPTLWQRLRNRFNGITPPAQGILQVASDKESAVMTVKEKAGCGSSNSEEEEVGVDCGGHSRNVVVSKKTKSRNTCGSE